MGLVPASLVALFVTLFVFSGLVYALDANQVGNPAAGIDIRTPLDAFQCDPWLIYYNIAPTDYGRSLGTDYSNIALHLTTLDAERPIIVKINIPGQGEGVISWPMNLKHNTKFLVNPHGSIVQGDFVQVKLGGGGDLCLSYATRTMSDKFVTYDASVFHSVQNRDYASETHPPAQRVTSPAAGLQTYFAAAGVVVTPTKAANVVPTSSKSTSTPTRDPISSPTSSSSSNTKSSPQESASSQSSPTSSGSVSATITPAPVTSGSGGSFGPSFTHSASQSGFSLSSDSDRLDGQTGDPRSSNGSSKVPIIVGSICGVFLLVFGILSCFLVARWRRNRARTPDALPYTMMSEGTVNNTTAATIASTSAVADPESPHPATAKGAVRLGSRRFFGTESVPGSASQADIDESQGSRTSAGMDLARALAVVAAHVRSGETMDDDPTGAPPQYSRTLTARTTSGGLSASSTMIVDKRRAGNHNNSSH
ncbi:hypothetical protein BKA62DRAFT_686242 [Auriculariales sp. MPI-PUGE-AT-0066]|nr:hypothetical protein BKA62DRAFT_686242 [Auriculariales sp. MPI-PUGE-AT-0066]